MKLKKQRRKKKVSRNFLRKVVFCIRSGDAMRSVDARDGATTLLLLGLPGFLCSHAPPPRGTVPKTGRGVRLVQTPIQPLLGSEMSEMEGRRGCQPGTVQVAEKDRRSVQNAGVDVRHSSKSRRHLEV